MFDKAFKRVNTFVDYKTELMEESSKRVEAEKESSSKRAGDELESDNSKKQKLDEHVEAEIDDDQEEAEMKKHMEIVQDDEVVIDAIPLATKPPIIVEWKIIKEGKIGYFQLIRADESLKSEVWRNLQGYKVTVWKLFSSCGVHFMRFQNMHIFMLAEKKYPLTPATIIEMLNKKLQTDYWNEMCYQLLKLMTKQGRIVGIKRLLKVAAAKVRVTTAKHNLVLKVIVAGADNHPPMLDKTNYSSWESQPRNETTLATVRARTYTDLTDEEKIRESVDIKATNIVLQARVQVVDTFTSFPGESIHSYYMRFAQLINDMHTIGMKMKPLQVNTKFVNHLQPEWSKFVTNVKLEKDMHTTNFDHFYAHLRQHEANANEVRLTRQRYPDQIALVANSPTYLNPTQYYPQLSYATQQYYSPPVQQRTKQPFKIEKSPCRQFRGDRHRDDLDASDSDCDDAPSAKAVFMANLSSYDSNILSEVPFHDTNIENDMSYQSLQETQCFEQPYFDNDTEVDITSDSNIISYKQYLQETENPVIQSTSSSAQQDELLMAVI
ncbi:hypothetical protein Tco_0731846 [Tanacetum coccineum]